MFNFNVTGKQQQKLPTEPTGTQSGTTVAAANSNVQQPAGEKAAVTGGTDAYIERRIDEIEAQRAAFAAKNPDFDMKAEMQNPDFVNYVWGNNLTVEDAYFLVHRDEILEQVRAEAIEEFNARSNRIPENGAAKNRPAIAEKNPKDLTDKEIDAIIERARNGEKITF